MGGTDFFDGPSFGGVFLGALPLSGFGVSFVPKADSGVTEGFSASLGAVLTFQSGLTLGAPWDREAVMLTISWLKKISNEMFGIWRTFYLFHETIFMKWSIRMESPSWFLSCEV